MVNVVTLKATNISIHIPPNRKTKNLQKYFGREYVIFLVPGKFFPVRPMDGNPEFQMISTQPFRTPGMRGRHPEAETEVLTVPSPRESSPG